MSGPLLQTEKRGLSVGRCITIVSPAKTAERIKMPFGLWTRVGLRNHVLDRGPDPTREGALLRRERGRPRRGPDMSGGFRFRCTRWGVRWRQMVNTIEPLVCSDNVTLCQITLTICFSLSA